MLVHPCMHALYVDNLYTISLLPQFLAVVSSLLLVTLQSNEYNGYHLEPL